MRDILGCGAEEHGWSRLRGRVLATERVGAVQQTTRVAGGVRAAGAPRRNDRPLDIRFEPGSIFIHGQAAVPKIRQCFLAELAFAHERWSERAIGDPRFLSRKPRRKNSVVGHGWRVPRLVSIFSVAAGTRESRKATKSAGTDIGGSPAQFQWPQHRTVRAASSSSWGLDHRARRARI